ncbi:MAG: Rieske (2Fe-2S) protein [Chitinophagales bacterium]
MFDKLRYKWVKLNEDQSYKLKVLEISKPTFVRVDDHRICVVRLDEGWFGVNNICPHAGAALHAGHCNKAGIVACPVHGYKFNVKTGISVDGNNYHVKTFKIEKREDGFYIGIKKF